jgi:hypothetical protein
MMDSPDTRLYSFAGRDGDAIQLVCLIVVANREPCEIPGAMFKARIGYVTDGRGIEHHVEVGISTDAVDYKCDIRICRRAQAIAKDLSQTFARFRLRSFRATGEAEKRYSE